MDKTETIHIANPLYDVVFRYLMEDNRVARLVLGAILGETVEDLRFEATVNSAKLGDAQITVTRMDFHARIQQADGASRMILIELQKAKLHQQIMRFRRYLGQQYQKLEHVDKDTKMPLPLYPIYILGEPITKATIPVIHVQRGYLDPATEQQIDQRHPFIEALTHDTTIIQTKHLSGRRRTELERILSIFDQTNRIDAEGHILALSESDYPEAYRPVIRRLQRALANPQIEQTMDLEDEVLGEFQRKDKQIAEAAEKIEAAQKQIEEEKKRTEEEKQRAEEEKEKAKASHQRFVEHLESRGHDLADIAKISGLSESVVRELLKRERK